jgi:hypothetical protein
MTTVAKGAAGFALAGAAFVIVPGAVHDDADVQWTERFLIEPGELGPTGRNPYFVLEPGYQLVLEDDDERLVITVLDETRVVDGVETRVVEERETKGGTIIEVSRNFFAVSRRTNSVFYFGEEVDDYKDGKLVGHAGAWISGENGARFGLIMPGVPLLEGRHYQEIAPGVAMDRARIVSMSETVKVPAGEFTNVLEVEETTPLEPREREYKLYAPGVGLLRDGGLTLVRYGPRAAEPTRP